MYDTILVPTDGSAGAQRAVEAVAPLAKQSDATVHLLHVVDLGALTPAIREEFREEIAEHASKLLEDIAASVELPGVSIVADMVESFDPIHQAILEYADDQDVDLLAMGTRNPAGMEWLSLGSVTRRTIRAGSRPVLTIPPHARLTETPSSILLPTDGSEGSLAAVSHAIELCETHDASLQVISVVDEDRAQVGVERGDLTTAMEAAGYQAVDEVLDRANEAGISTIQTSVKSGNPGEEIVTYANEHDVDLITMGTHGRSGLDRLAIGSVAERVFSITEVPVLAIKP